MIRLHRARTQGQSAVENALVISVLTVAVVGASFIFVPSFRTGTGELSKDVYAVLNGGTIGSIGQNRGGGEATDAGSGQVGGGDMTAGGGKDTGSGDAAGPPNLGGRPSGGGTGGRGPDTGSIIDQANAEMSGRGTGDIGESRKGGPNYPSSSPALGAVTGDFGTIGNQ